MFGSHRASGGRHRAAAYRGRSRARSHEPRHNAHAGRPAFGTHDWALSKWLRDRGVPGA